MNIKHNCQKCGKCCILSLDNPRGIVIVFPSDVSRLAKGLGISPHDFIRYYCKKIDLKNNLVLYALDNNQERCMFLTPDNLCSIHNFKPVQCQKTPYGFFSQYHLWKHMPCINEDTILSSDSLASDLMLLTEVINGYGQYTS